MTARKAAAGAGSGAGRATKRTTPAKPARPARGTRVARQSEPQELTDPVSMRALAHPLRLSLMDLLRREGPLTATEAAELTGESPANCSFHLRTLAKYGFVEEDSSGPGRSRPWRLVALGNRFDSTNVDSEEMNAAASHLTQMYLERDYEQLRQWITSAPTLSPEWREVGFYSNGFTYLTPDELEGICAEIEVIKERYRGRALDRSTRPAGSRAVSFIAFGYPLPPSPTGN